MRFALRCILLLVLTQISLAGCCTRGAKVETKSFTTTKSLGEELVDLKTAYESGAITEKQYDELKKNTISRHSQQ